MPTTIIAADTIQAALAEALQRIDRLEAAVTAKDEQVAEQFAEQTIQIGELREQDLAQTAALKALQTQLPATIRAIAGGGDSGQGAGRGDARRGGSDSGQRDSQSGARGDRSGGGNGRGDGRSNPTGGGRGGSGNTPLRAVDPPAESPDERASATEKGFSRAILSVRLRERSARFQVQRGRMRRPHRWWDANLLAGPAEDLGCRRCNSFLGRHGWQVEGKRRIFGHGVFNPRGQNALF